MRALLLIVSLAGSACGGGATCPEILAPKTGTWDLDLPAETGHDAVIHVGEVQVELDYTDADGKVWRVTWDKADGPDSW
ncbi:MAG: hypothetical protein ACI9MC_003203 [Kiritimatiellia bacterium]|jgi:hypothetical protein